jgi:phosphoglycolate phosphatase
MMSSSVAAAMSAARGVVFDKDGTLIDLDARWVPAFNALIGRLAARCDDLTMVDELAESLGIDGDRLVADGPAAVDTAAQIIDRVVVTLATRGHEVEAATRMVNSIVVDIGGALGPVAAIGNLTTSLTALRALGLSVGVATSDDRANTVAELTDLGVADLVDTLRCADDGTPTKPDPRVLTSIADEWSHRAGDLVFVGDSRNDMETARAAGCPFIARCDSGRTPTWAADADAVIDSIDRLVPA